MLDSPTWYESRRIISMWLADGLIKKLRDSPALTQERVNVLMTIRDINSFDPAMLEANRSLIYRDLISMGISEEKIRDIPLFEDYSP